MEALTNEESDYFIDLVSQYPCLFDRKNANYKNSHVKENVWREIAEKVNKTSESCKKQWKTIRDGYMRFKRKNKLPTGSAAPKNNRSKWKIYRLLSFLDNVPQERSTIGSIYDDTESSQNTVEEPEDLAQYSTKEEALLTHFDHNIEQTNASMSTESDVHTPIKTNQQLVVASSNKRRPNNKEDIISYMREREKSRLSLMKNVSQSCDEFNSFASHIEQVLRKLPTKVLQIKAKQELFQVLTKFEILAAEHDASSTSSTPTTVSDNTQCSSLNVMSPTNSSSSDQIDLTYRQNEDLPLIHEFPEH
uniref:Transcription factor Adf-1-like n=1 Tax=Diabrotica virgifera virgifera TaxID=50390 RepID=A0A6P7GCS4_DIAVI